MKIVYMAHSCIEEYLRPTILPMYGWIPGQMYPKNFRQKLTSTADSIDLYIAILPILAVLVS